MWRNEQVRVSFWIGGRREKKRKEKNTPKSAREMDAGRWEENSIFFYCYCFVVFCCLLSVIASDISGNWFWISLYRVSFFFSLLFIWFIPNETHTRRFSRTSSAWRTTTCSSTMFTSSARLSESKSSFRNDSNLYRVLLLKARKI